MASMRRGGCFTHSVATLLLVSLGPKDKCMALLTVTLLSTFHYGSG